MQCFRSPVWAKITLFFFTTMLLYQPAFAGESLSHLVRDDTQISPKTLPVSYVNDIQFQRLTQEYQRMGYTVKQGTPEQLRRLLLASNDEPVASPQHKQSDADKTTAESTVSEDNTGCEKPGKTKQPQTNKKEDKTEANTKTAVNADNNTANDNNNKRVDVTKCDEENTSKDKDNQQDESATSTKPMVVQMPQPPPPVISTPVPVPPPPPTVIIQPGIDVNVGIHNSGRGGSSDSAKVFFIITGIFVVAAFVVYVGKYIVDIAQGNQHDLWWEVIFNNTFLDTNARQHGRFNGVKIATGFNSSDVIQVALMGELGNASLNLIFDEDTSPSIVDFTTTYWMLGATARLFLSYNQLNSSYLFMDFMGGKTRHSETDTIGAARMGISFGIYDHARLGVSYGAQYIGLNSNQGFVHNSGQYWYTFGVELGVRF